jgi:UDP-glucose 4-epimerase
MMYNNRKCIVFGANGYLGRHLVYFLKNADFDVKAFDIQDNFESFETDYLKLDISKVFNLKNIDWNVDYIFIFAGITGTFNGFNNYNKFIIINEISLLNILNEIRKSDFRPRVIFPSSRLVYKGSDSPLKEEDQKEAKTIYAVNKIACENILEAYNNSFDIPYTIYRLCVPYGNILGTDYSYGTIGFFLNQAKNKGTINLYGDGSLRRTFTNVEDICNQVILSCPKKKSVNQVYNTMGEEYSLKEIALLVTDKYNAKLTFSEWPDTDFRIESGHTVFDSQKIKNDFNLELKNSVENWLAQI